MEKILEEKEPKKVVFDWELGHDIISLHVESYAYWDNLYIGMVSYGEEGAVPFADMTVNIPAFPLKANEAFISNDISADIVRFIQKNKLGKVVATARHRYGNYPLVAFDMGRLREFDPIGVAEYEELRGIQFISKVEQKKLW